MECGKSHESRTEPNDFVTLYAIHLHHAFLHPYKIPEIDSVLVSRRGTTIRRTARSTTNLSATALFLLLPLSLLPIRQRQ